MPRFQVPPRPRASSPVWPRVAVLAILGVLAAGCSDSARFDSNPYASNTRPPEVTGSIGTRPAPSRVTAQPLPAPTRPATVAATGTTGYASGAPGLGAYRPNPQRGDVTGSVPAAPQPSGHWTWDGGQAVSVGQGETVETIAHKHHVPASAIMQVNNLRSATDIRPGQRLVIPRWVANAPAPHLASAAPAPVAHAGAEVHVVAPGETMMSISRKYGVTLSALARANNMRAFDKLSIGQRINVPAGATRKVADARVPAAPPKVAPPRTAPAESVGAVPAQHARIVTPEPAKNESVAKDAEPAGAIPAFRWPVKGRVISGFGTHPNGVTNDGVNLAVPMGTPIKAADDGVVAYAGNELKGYGNLVLIRHANNFVSAYANASELLVKRGDTVKRGQVIAKAGQTGNVTSPQLHFEIRKGSTPIDPLKYLSGA